MSWTLLLFAEEPPRSTATPDCQFQGIGSPAETRKRISLGLGNRVVWCEDGWGHYGDDSCMLEFHVPENENPVICVMIHVRGMGAVETLLRLAQENSWCVVDDSFTPVSG
jgi:hypothetical protein